MDRAKEEVLRYLGRRAQAVPAELDALVDDCMRELRDAARPLHSHRVFPLDSSGDELLVPGTALRLPGANIRAHLKDCIEVALLAATLGVAADNLIRRWEVSDLTRSLVLDACATQLIEEVTDGVDATIARDAATRGLHATTRFSPGYGDLPLDIQPPLLAVLDTARRIGLTCTESLIMLPRKSVTALIGLSKTTQTRARGCSSCPSRANCPYRKDESDGCPRMDS